MNIRLIATDLDSTLFHIDKSVSDYTAGVFRRCREAGIVTAFATARSEAACLRAAKLIRPDILITCGGALVRFGRELLLHAPLPASLAWELVSFCRALPSTGRILAEMADGRYLVSYETPPGAVGDYAHAEHCDFTRPFDADALKLVIHIGDNADRSRLRAAFPDVTLHAYSDSKYCFIAARGVSKWRAIKTTAAAISADLSNVVCFGDDNNDIEMLQKAGVGVAVENAIPAAKAASDYICGHCNDDGMARWIEENVL